MSGPRRIPQPPPLPEDLAFVLIDGDNLLHRVRGNRDDGAVRWLLPRLRAWRPNGVRIVLMLDGHPEPGESFRRQIVTGIESHYSGVVDGDTALIKLLSSRPYADRIRTVLITDDRQLQDRAKHLSAFVRRLDWFAGQLASGNAAVLRTSSPEDQADMGPASKPGGTSLTARPVGVGSGRPPRRAPGTGGSDPSRDTDGEPEHKPWKPGRGATKKTGNPKRGHDPA